VLLLSTTLFIPLSFIHTRANARDRKCKLMWMLLHAFWSSSFLTLPCKFVSCDLVMWFQSWLFFTVSKTFWHSNFFHVQVECFCHLHMILCSSSSYTLRCRIFFNFVMSDNQRHGVIPPPIVLEYQLDSYYSPDYIWY